MFGGYGRYRDTLVAGTGLSALPKARESFYQVWPMLILELAAQIRSDIVIDPRGKMDGSRFRTMSVTLCSMGETEICCAD